MFWDAMLPALVANIVASIFVIPSAFWFWGKLTKPRNIRLVINNRKNQKLELAITKKSNFNFSTTFSVENNSDQALERVYWSFWIPKCLNPKLLHLDGGDLKEDIAPYIKLNGKTAVRYSGHLDAVVFPGTRQDLKLVLSCTGLWSDLDYGDEIKWIIGTKYGYYPAKPIDKNFELTKPEKLGSFKITITKENSN